MSNIETAIAAIEAEKNIELEKVNELESLIGRLRILGSNNTDNPIPSNILPDPPLSNQKRNENELFKDYPYDRRLSEKLLFLDSVIKRPFRTIDRLKEIERHEGEARRIEYAGRLSQQLHYMIKNMTYIGQKYGSNSETFYFRENWADWDGHEYKIKPEYQITPEEFDAAGIPQHKRNKFIWLGIREANLGEQTVS